ncbi:4'-phosphopantetheinyl transferase superfamily protein [Streptomyces sp. NPDC052682]|uniref:4'-phosphopantetheinyl transferase family protein n=1 Tax=Streptomyces sp. NPDC052682 TaxID=3154954 RepID=UPI003448DB75
MLIARVLPPAAVGEEAYGDPEDGAGQPALFPAEEREIAHAGYKRRREFTTGRVCARRALTRLGLAPAPLPPGPTGAPAWPAGVTGSITHCAGYRAAAVARSAELAGLGIDAEPHAPVSPAVRRGITSPSERAHLDRLDAVRPGIHWDRLLFSAKESVYKACSFLAPRALRFEDAEVTFSPGTGTFTAHLAAGSLVLTGRWHVSHGILLTAAALPGRATPWTKSEVRLT